MPIKYNLYLFEILWSKENDYFQILKYFKLLQFIPFEQKTKKLNSVWFQWFQKLIKTILQIKILKFLLSMLLLELVLYFQTLGMNKLITLYYFLNNFKTFAIFMNFIQNLTSNE